MLRSGSQIYFQAKILPSGITPWKWNFRDGLYSICFYNQENIVLSVTEIVIKILVSG